MVDFINSTLRLATPLIFASMGGILCERAGIATICLEGVILISAFTAAVVDYYTSNPVLSLSISILAGGLFMSLHALLTLKLRTDQIISAVTVNLFAAGLTPILVKTLFYNSTNTPSLPREARLLPFSIPYLSQLPVVGELFNHLLLVYIAIFLPFLLHFFLYRTRFGLYVVAAGDGPQALLSSGVSVNKTRFWALFFGGSLVSLAGTYLAIGHSSQFIREMSAGRGFIALAAIIIGKWRPLPTLFACLLFGVTDALQIQLQSSDLWGVRLPVQFIQSVPYLISLLVLVFAVGQAKPPLSIGKTDL